MGSDLSHVTSLGTPTGTGNLVRDTSPTIATPTITTPTLTSATLSSPTMTTPVLGVASATSLAITSGALTAGTMTYSKNSLVQSAIHRFDWTNAMIVALGAALTGDITICTLPAKTVVQRVWSVLTGQAAGPTTLTMSIGYTAATYVDYLIAASIKQAVNTIIGAVAGDLGTKLVGYDVPSVASTTALKAHFIATVSTLDQTTSSTGQIYIETITLP